MKDLIHIIQGIEQEVKVFELGDQSFSNRPTLMELAQKNQPYAVELIERIDGICDVIDNMLEVVDFSVLYWKKRMLFSIGYHVSSQTPDAGCYDLIASESLLTSFLAIARGEVPVKHWYKLAKCYDF